MYPNWLSTVTVVILHEAMAMVMNIIGFCLPFS